MQSIEQMQVEQIETDEHDFSVEATVPDALGGVSKLHDALSDVADSFDVAGFKCVKCGLVHKHDTTKHRLSDTFDVDASTTSEMEYLASCHCGVNEAGRRGSEFGIDESRAAQISGKAPIPPEVSREMTEKFGSL